MLRVEHSYFHSTLSSPADSRSVRLYEGIRLGNKHSQAMVTYGRTEVSRDDQRNSVDKSINVVDWANKQPGNEFILSDHTK